MTEQELYYERKNREAKEWQEFGANTGILALVITAICLLYVAWPVLLGLGVLYLIFYVLGTILEIIKDTFNFCKKVFEPILKIFEPILKINFAFVFNSIGMIGLVSFLLIIIYNIFLK